MGSLYKDFLADADSEFLMRETEKLWQCEFGQTFKDYHKAAEYTFRLMKDLDIPNVEMKYYPADGKTTYNDIQMPIAWDATIGKLALLDGSGLVINFKEHPFQLIKGSVSTPPGGQVIRIITEAQFLAGADPRNSLVMLNPETMPRANALKPILDRGGLGLITDKIENRELHYNAIGWVNAGTEDGAWHVLASHRDFISFSVSPRNGDRIRAAAASGQLTARVECDGRRYEGILPAVTALIPGHRREEVWIYAHMFEPLSDDDANGVVAGIESARLIMEKGTPEFSIRLLFAMELYGYMAYIAQCGSNLRSQVIGGCNYDALASAKNAGIRLYPAGGATPFYGNLIAECLAEQLAGATDVLPCKMEMPQYWDDQSFTDPTISIPGVWPIGEYGDAHHSSVQTMEFLDKIVFTRGTAFNTAFVWNLANPSEDDLFASTRIAEKHLVYEAAKPDCNIEQFTHRYEIERRHLNDFRRALSAEPVDDCLAALECKYHELAKSVRILVPTPTPWRNYAEMIVMKRQTFGFPHNLVKVSAKEKIVLPKGVIYGHFANVLANMDGVHDIATLIRLAEYERENALSEQEVKQYVNTLNFLCDHEYLECVRRPEVTRNDIASALHKLGITKESLLLVHSSLSGCGYISGGMGNVISLLRETAGGVLFPTFTRSYIYLGGPMCDWRFCPFDSTVPEQVCTGILPRAVLTQYPEAKRSQHVSHSWAGFGVSAEACLDEHRMFDPPCSPTSPMGKAFASGGKILYFGTGISSTTFLHYLEDQANLPYLGTAVCQAKNPDGSVKTGTVEKHLPGHRDFYRSDAENCKFFRRAIASGLEIRSVGLGMGKLQLIDLRQLYEIGMRLIAEDPRVLLCDDPECFFCRKFQ